ncbi:DUF4352 domain-containing protein [Herbidospora daliensis]|uniref:DUF4352 domain-containing protein n=1 Tax=Herbidospora daliensis TaxID=295585 RepID=UPI00078175A7|nr:DUF4352 domain-containing protein [Herbidospora daliensis]
MVTAVVFLLLVGGCFALILNVDDRSAGRETLATPDRKPTTSEPTSPVTESQPAPAGGPVALGSAVTLHGMDSDLQVDATVSQVFDPATPANDFIKPDAGSRWVAVELQLKNTGTAVYSDAPGNGLKLIDTQGQQYSQTFGEVKEGVTLSSITANPGDSRKGVILFEVSKDAELATLQFALNSGFADEKGEWTIS